MRAPRPQPRPRGGEAGADGYIAWPIANRDLLARVGACVRILRLSRAQHRRSAELAQKVGAATHAQLASLSIMEEAVAGQQHAERPNLKLQEEIALRHQAESAVTLRLAELKRWQDGLLNREDRIQEFKHELNELARRRGESVRYSNRATGADDSAAPARTPSFTPRICPAIEPPP